MKKETLVNNLLLKSLQEILSIGYLSLLLFGLIRETITYGILGINIMSYSSILDILLSPIIILTGNRFLLTAVIIIPLLFYWATKLFKKFHTYNKEKEWYQKRFDVAQLDEEYAKENFSMVFVITMTFGLLLGVFFSSGVLDGYKYKKELEEGSVKMTHVLTFMDKDRVPVKIIGQNSQYVFYVLDKKKEIAISPIQGNIKRIEQLKKVNKK
jgi:hypothetical protein